MNQSCGIITKLENENAVILAKKIHKFLCSKGYNVFPEINLANITGLKNGKAIKDLYADFIITLGGDGTVLRTCMYLPEPDTPILAVNMGRRGYLTEVEPINVFNSIEDFSTGKYRLDHHSKLSIFIEGDYLIDSLNEALITSPSPSKMIHLNLNIDSGESINFSADGVIVSTPTGSTAHSFSAGGPILHTELDAFNIVFICPLEPIRSIIVPDSRNVKLRVGKNISALVTVDGTLEKEISANSEVLVKKAEKKAVFIRFGEQYLSKSLTRLISRGIKIGEE